MRLINSNKYKILVNRKIEEHIYYMYEMTSIQTEIQKLYTESHIIYIEQFKTDFSDNTFYLIND